MTREEAREELITFIGTFECPSLEAVEIAIEALKDRPKGEWIVLGEWVSRSGCYGVAYCSECNYELRGNNTNFCPNCGAEMEGARND